MTPGPRYRALVYLTLLASFLVVVWGGVVRVSGSGLGCPDWPTCHGQFLPGLDVATQIEWFHRFLGVAGGLTLAALGITTIAAHRHDRAMLWLVVAAGALYIFQAVLGAVVVLLELPDTWVTAHLANAELVLAVLTTLAVRVRWPSVASARVPGAPRISTFRVTLRLETLTRQRQCKVGTPWLKDETPWRGKLAATA